MKALNRRQLLAGVGASLLGGGVRAAETTRLLAARKTGAGYEAVLLDRYGSIQRAVPLSARGHSGAVLSDRWAVLFARRPGRFALAFDLRNPSRTLRFNPPTDRHFYGHGLFDTRSGWLYATENAFDSARGVLGIYDSARAFRRVGEWNLQAIGPHEIVAGPVPGTAVVAIGGIETHPAWPRRKLNLPTMQPGLVWLDLHDGRVLEKATLSESARTLSIRHLAMAGNAVWFACQDESPTATLKPLLGIWRPGSSLSMIADSARPDLHAYLGAIAASPDGSAVAVTAPRGSRAMVFATRTRKSVARFDIADVCGVAAVKDGFLFSSGQGGIWHNDRRLGGGQGAWDNHMTAL